MADKKAQAMKIRSVVSELRKISKGLVDLAHDLREIDWSSDSEVLGEIAVRLEEIAHFDDEGDHLLANAVQLEHEADRFEGVES